MSIHLKNNAIGVDKKINRYINRINDYLNTEKNWGVDIYHKVYRELDSNGNHVPYVFYSDKDYNEVFVNDKAIGEVGFYLNPERTIEGGVNVDCDVIFSLNLDKIDGGSLQREDEKAMMIALAAVEDCEEVTGVKTQLRNVFSDFNTERIKNRDMQPFINFSFTISINYQTSRCYDM